MSNIIQGAADAGECTVNLNTETFTVDLTIRAPLSIGAQTVTLGAYQFIAVFGQTIAAIGQALADKISGIATAARKH